MLFAMRVLPLYWMLVPEFWPTPGIRVTVSDTASGATPVGDFLACSVALRLIDAVATYSLYERLLKLLKSFKNFDSLEGSSASFCFPLSTSTRLTYDFLLPGSKPS